MLGLRLYSKALQMRTVRALTTSAARSKVTSFTMPAMSPTMEQGNIVEWKVSDGGSFHAGDILLSIETDKATMDVEAQDDGIMGKIIFPSGSKDVPVNKLIALVAEEGDDISNLEVPKEAEESKPADPESAPAPKSDAPSEPAGPAQNTFTRPLFPSVLRLIEEHGISDAEKKITPTGPHGMITKGDVLAFLGKARTPFGTSSPEHTTVTQLGGAPKGGDAASKEAEKPKEPLSSNDIRSQIISGLVSLSQKEPKESVDSSWDAVIGSYI